MGRGNLTHWDTEEEQAGFKHKPSPVRVPIPKFPVSSSPCVQNIKIQQGENHIEDEDVHGRCQPWTEVEEMPLLTVGVTS